MTANPRSCYVSNQLGLPIIATLQVTPQGLHLLARPVFDEDAEPPSDGSGVRALPIENAGPNSPDAICVIQPDCAFRLSIPDSDLVAWREPLALDRHSRADGDGFGFMLKLVTVQEVGDDCPTLAISRGPRIFRVASELAFPVQLTCRLKQHCFTMSADADIRPGCGTAAALARLPSAAVTLRDAIEAEDGDDPYCQGVIELDDEDAGPNTKCYAIEPGGYFTVVLAEGELPRWQIASDLRRHLDMDVQGDLPEFALDFFYREEPNTDLLTFAILTPDDSTFN